MLVSSLINFFDADVLTSFLFSGMGVWLNFLF